MGSLQQRWVYWRKRLDPQEFNLGSGDRSLFKDGGGAATRVLARSNVAEIKNRRASVSSQGAGPQSHRL
ncbi:hypothetical protein C1H70_16110 [Halomonas urumqiensis]|uniref:Uncharacterized protein n=1 Tax=Halomonas urumqiensis TaxID=1684789 RepID=A0A2N7UCV3_9GAMM|nr:hypothetical protein C1H70_16110 [Halomonas urumqiensis]PTB03433.1 hypothetical protein C6V82_02745 [Halomonas urumqiensis]GHE20388.1 hypothetical protein GCM10017767_09090 [Halomonas urumqiensis]